MTNLVKLNPGGSPYDAEGYLGSSVINSAKTAPSCELLDNRVLKKVKLDEDVLNLFKSILSRSMPELRTLEVHNKHDGGCKSYFERRGSL